MGDTVGRPKARCLFRAFGWGTINPPDDVERETSNDNSCCRTDEGGRDV